MKEVGRSFVSCVVFVCLCDCLVYTAKKRCFFSLVAQSTKLNQLAGSQVEKVGEDSYRVSIAVAGFSAEELDVEVREGMLIVKSNRADADDSKSYLHRGIAARAFERRFQLAEHVKVTGAGLDNGLLTIDLAREVPEALKPRTIEIKSGGPKAIEAKKAA